MLTHEYAIVPVDGTNESSSHFLRREYARDIWYVCMSPAMGSKPVDWRICTKGTEVYVPMFPYITRDDPSEAMGFMMQLGATIVNDFNENRRGGVIGMPEVYVSSKLHLAVGAPVSAVKLDGEDALRIHVGAAVLATPR